jgi:hypothetical protein
MQCTDFIIKTTCLFFRLKYMQATALVTGDEFLLKYNIEIDASDVYEHFLVYNFEHRSSDGHLAGIIHFDDRWGANLAKLYTAIGPCFTFNNLNADQFYNLDLLPEQFNYPRVVDYSGMKIERYALRSANPEERNMTYPLHATSIDSRCYLNCPYSMGYSRQADSPEAFDEGYIIDGYRYFIHSPYETLTKSTKHITNIIPYSIQGFITPSQTLIDDSLKSYAPKQY